MNDVRTILERAYADATPPPDGLERMLRRRDRKRRNQRIAAGVVGIAVFVAAIWIVTSGLAFDQSTPAVPGSQKGRTQTAPPPALTSGAPDVVRQRTCSEGARSRLELTTLGQFYLPRGSRVRFEVHRSPVGHSWRITLRGNGPKWGLDPDGIVFFRGIRVASDSGDLAVQRDRDGVFLVQAKAVDTQTGQVCRVDAGTLSPPAGNQ
jgi:hypothetical protein